MTTTTPDAGTPDAGPRTPGPAPAAEVEPPARRGARRFVDIGVVTAVVALLFTGVTYWVDRRSQDREDARSARSELTAVVGQIAAVPRLYAAQADTGAVLDSSSQANSELLVLATQAEQLMSDHSSIVGPADHLAVGFAHLRLLNFARALEQFQVAEALAAERDDRSVGNAARLQAAQARFGLGRIAEGRIAYEQAIDRLDTAGNSRLVEEAEIDYILYLWLNAEAVYGDCASALRLLPRFSATVTPEIQALAEEVTTACGAP